MVTSNAVARVRDRTIIETDLLTLGDYETKTVTLLQSNQYMFMNIHAIQGGEIVLLTSFNGSLYKTKVCSGRGTDTTFTINGNAVTFKANAACRGHLFKVTEPGTT